MNTLRRTPYLLLLLGLVLSASVMAQQPEEAAEPALPDLSSLQNNWWAYFEGPRDEVEPRKDAFLAAAGTQIAELAPQNQAIAQTILDAIRDNFSALLPLLDDAEVAAPDLDPEAASYSMDELLSIAAQARRALRSPRAMRIANRAGASAMAAAAAAIASR